MSDHSSAPNPGNKKSVLREMLEQKLITLQAQATEISAALAMVEREARDLCDENAVLKKLEESIMTQITLQDARNEAIKWQIQWLKALTSNQPVASEALPFSPENAADLLFNLQSHERAARALLRLAGDSSGGEGGDDELPWSTSDGDDSQDESSENSGVVEDLDKPADPPTFD
ncbi:hypothetical protein ACJRO7_030058 [Eucalyptus globulus]|uniref:Uncharacterized protein n=1 Tax=Eucalyptus globulus TaxID=34317 RepID=A0ABD3JDW3_EUCGL